MSTSDVTITLFVIIILEDNERITWNLFDGNSVRLERPTVEDVQYVISILKHEKNINDVIHKVIYLYYSPTQSTLLLLILLNETAVSCLWIHNTTLTEQCDLQCLNDTNITELGLVCCTIADVNSICQLINTNTTLTDLTLYTDELTDNQLTQILDSLTFTGILSLTLSSQYKTKCMQHKVYQQLIHKLCYR